MNKRERETACAMVAAWEWTQGGSSSEAAALSRCAREVISGLQLPADDMRFARAWEIYRLASRDTEDDALFDAIVDRAEADYDGLIELIEQVGFDGLRDALPTPPHGEEG